MVSLRGLKDLTNSEGEGRSDAERRLNVKRSVPLAVREVEAHESAAVAGEEEGETRRRRNSAFFFPCPGA